MRYTGSLAKEEREKIFRLFVDDFALKFSEIEKRLDIRSNKLSYHLEQMQKEGLLQKQGLMYSLTREGEKFLPVLSHITGEDLSPLPVILVAPVRKGKVLLAQRTKRPYKDYWGFVGGKMRMHETVAEACERKLIENGMRGKMRHLCAVAHEHVEQDGAIKHGFLLLLVRADAEAQESERMRWFSKAELRKAKVIPSDLWLTGKLGEKIEMRHVVMHERDGRISGFRLS